MIKCACKQIYRGNMPVTELYAFNLICENLLAALYGVALISDQFKSDIMPFLNTLITVIRRLSPPQLSYHDIVKALLYVNSKINFCYKSPHIIK